MTTKELKEKLDLRYEPIAFHSPQLAVSYASRCDDPMRVVLGDWDEERDEGVVWVVCPSDAAKLERAGYEIA
jgi:hypothetical protein